MNAKPYASTPSQKILIAIIHNIYATSTWPFTDNYETHLYILGLMYLALLSTTSTAPHTSRDFECYDTIKTE